MAGLGNIPYRIWLISAFVVLLGVSTIHPLDWQDFVLEHVLTITMLGALIMLTRRRPLSNVSCTLIFAFLALHVLGAHYTYSKVPYDDWSQLLFGRTVSDVLHLRRNHFDRLVHFSWGLLLLVPMRELVMRWLQLTGARASIVAIAFLATMSASYEMLEWMFTLIMSPEAADAYNGQQGDMFDAQKDAGLALSGSIIAAIVVTLAGSGRGGASTQ